MIFLPSTVSTFFDVDDTLIMWSPTPEQIAANGVEIECPGSYALIDGELRPSRSWKAMVVPHQYHLQQLIKHSIRGHMIVVWSAGGWDWALAVVKALGIEDHVDLVISKPTWCYDDLPPSEYMPKSQWKKDE